MDTESYRADRGRHRRLFVATSVNLICAPFVGWTPGVASTTPLGVLGAGSGTVTRPARSVGTAGRYKTNGSTINSIADGLLARHCE